MVLDMDQLLMGALLPSGRVVEGCTRVRSLLDELPDGYDVGVGDQTMHRETELEQDRTEQNGMSQCGPVII